MEIIELVARQFKQKDLFSKALTHRSYLNENETWTLGHNDVLEFLGDAVLELIVTDYLCTTFPDKDEGELTFIRSTLVKTESLATVAKWIGIPKHVRLSRGQQQGDMRAMVRIYACTYEAVVGALYKDQGYESVKSFVSETLLACLSHADMSLFRDPKSILQEKAQTLTQETPRYEVLSETGPDHMRQFVIGAYLGSEQIGIGKGPSKKEAQTSAAKAALKAKGWE